jgi:hypothetical protein
MLLHATIAGLVSVVLPVAAQPAAAAVVTEYDYVTEPAVQKPTYCANTIAGTSVCFAPDGDHFIVMDWAADGHSAAAEWRNYGAEHGPVRACTYESSTRSAYQCGDWVEHGTVW